MDKDPRFGGAASRPPEELAAEARQAEGWPPGLELPAAPKPGPSRVTMAVVGGAGPSRAVLVVISNAGGAAYAMFTPQEAVDAARNLERVAAAARTGLVIGTPGDGGPGGGGRRGPGPDPGL